MSSNRQLREEKTLKAMFSLYCHAEHVSEPGLCPACDKVLSYALQRLENCTFGANKPTCARCSIHCYKPDMRDDIKKVMRYAGPRMLWRHPLLAIRHFLDGLKIKQNDRYQ